MLVLSRRAGESVHFPELNISIEIVKSKGSAVRLGIDAPMEIKVLRGEIVGNESCQSVTRKIAVHESDDHKVRNALNSISIASAMVRKQIARGNLSAAASILDRALESIKGVEEQQPPATRDLSNGNARALLVEDAANEREMLAGFLRLHGYAVDTARDGVLAMEYLEDHDKPDFILMDMNLPRLDGAATIRRIRENSSFDNVDIFAVSGQTPNSVGLDLGNDNIRQWFQKPLDPVSLVTAINDCLTV